MSLPTTVPNTVSAPIVYPKHRDNNWGAYMNDNFQHLAERTDVLKIDVRDKTKDIELSVAAHFVNLKNAMNKVADEYTETVGASRQNVMLKLKADIDTYIASAVNKMYEVTVGQLAENEEIRSNLLLAITDIQTNFNLTEGYIQAGIDKINKILDNEIEATAAGKIDVVNKTKTVRDLLLEHMSDFNNPHEFNSAQDATGAPVYQPDPVGVNAIFPLTETDLIEVVPDEEDVNFTDDEFITTGDDDIVIGTLSTLHQFLLGKYLVLEATPTLPIGSYYRFGHNSAIIDVGITADRAIEEGDAVAAVTSTGPALEITLTWLQTTEPPFGHAENDFNILAFTSTAPAEGDTVVINTFVEGGVNPVKSYTTTIKRINYTNKPTVIDEIIQFTTGDPIELSRGYLKFNNLSSPNLLHWSNNTIINPGNTVKLLEIFNESVTHDFDDDEVLFEVPQNLKDDIGNNWSEVEAVRGTADHEEAAVHYFSDGYLHIFFKPDPSTGLANAYIVQLNNLDPINVTYNPVSISRYTWDTKTNNPATLVVTGTADIVI